MNKDVMFNREYTRKWFKSRNLKVSNRILNSDISRIIRKQSRLHSYYVQACNGPALNTANILHQESLQSDILAILADYNLYATFNDDPRGNPVFIHEIGVPEEQRTPNNDLGGRGWAIW